MHYNETPHNGDPIHQKKVLPQYFRDKLKKLKLIGCDFDGVFTDGKVLVNENGTESVLCSRKDSLRLQELKERGITFIVISKEKNPIVGMRCEKMRIEYFQGVDNKLALFKKLADQAGVRTDETAFIGDDINDLDCLRFSEVAFSIADGAMECKQVADYVTERKGGDHAVREICDLILGQKQNKGKH